MFNLIYSVPILSSKMPGCPLLFTTKIKKIAWPPPGHPQCENRVLTLWVTGRRPVKIDLVLHVHSDR